MLLNNIDKLIQEMSIHDVYDHVTQLGSEYGHKIADKYHHVMDKVGTHDIAGSSHREVQNNIHDKFKHFDDNGISHKLRMQNIAQDDGIHNRVSLKLSDNYGGGRNADLSMDANQSKGIARINASRDGISVIDKDVPLNYRKSPVI